MFLHVSWVGWLCFLAPTIWSGILWGVIKLLSRERKQAE